MMGCMCAHCCCDGERQRGQSIGGESISMGRAIVAGVFSHVDVSPPSSTSAPVCRQRWAGAACPRVTCTSTGWGGACLPPVAAQG